VNEGGGSWNYDLMIISIDLNLQIFNVTRKDKCPDAVYLSHGSFIQLE
jgi:hypothetical protein